MKVARENNGFLIEFDRRSSNEIDKLMNVPGIRVTKKKKNYTAN